MAEFQEVLKQWNRMCKAFGEDCDKCPIKYSPCQYISFDILHLSSKEQPIMKWAAEHPEPVYPTWFEWFKTVVPDEEMLQRGMYWDMQIPADIAEKLGLQPKEDA